MPNLLTAVARDTRTVRVTFDGALGDLTTGPNGALNPANWDFDGQPSLTGLDPYASVTAKSLTQVSTAIVDILGADDFTPGATYQVTAAPASAGGITGIPDPPNNKATFVAFTPPSPAGRDFDITTFVPRMNLDEDDTKDLLRFLNVLKDPLLLHLDRIDRWTDILDLTKAPSGFLDLILQALGDPFEFALSDIDKRRLASVLVRIYQQKGTVPGMKNAIRFFIGYEADIVFPDNSLFGGWIMDVSHLDVDTVLGLGPYYDPTIHGPDTGGLVTAYDFYVKVGKPAAAALSSDEDARVRVIVDYMKPAHLHLKGVSSVLPPPTTPAALAGSGQITVSWTAVAGASGYVVFWSRTPIVGVLSPNGVVDPDNASPYVITPVPSGEQRYAVVAAIGPGGVNGVGSAVVMAAAT
jgi:phage tail-like protein